MRERKEVEEVEVERERCRAKFSDAAPSTLRPLLSSSTTQPQKEITHRFRKADVHPHAVDLVDDALAVGRPDERVRVGERGN